MTTSREGLARLRASAGVLQSMGRGRAGNETAIYARALLERAEITEEYFVRQEISKNPWVRMTERPAGRIELAAPFDGYQYFTRAAWEDVAHGLSAQRGPSGSAVIGHLLLRDYSNTNLRQRLPLADGHGSIPIEVPIGGGDPDALNQLRADQQACAARYDFEPDPPEVLPAQLSIELYDPDSFDLADPDLDLLALDLRSDQARRQLNDVVTKIRQQVGFRDELVLKIDIQLSLPVRAGHRGLRPKVTRMAIDWPTITSLRTLSLRVGDCLPGHGQTVTLSDAPVSYNPVRECIEWENVKIFAVDGELETPDEEMGESGESGEGKIRHYRSAPMLLSIEHPGELYKQDVLGVAAEVSTPGYLMSGMAARVYDATGYYLTAPLKLTSKVNIAAELMLDDAFATRKFSPNQQLFFDEIIPDEMRIADIQTALADRGFTVLKIWPDGDKPYYDQVSKAVSWLHVAHRKVGPDDMVLWILTTGRHFETERETTMYGGGVTNKTKLQTGELRIFIRGQLPRDSRELTHEMNALQRTLRERYDRVRQRR